MAGCPGRATLYPEPQLPLLSLHLGRGRACRWRVRDRHNVLPRPGHPGARACVTLPATQHITRVWGLSSGSGRPWEGRAGDSGMAGLVARRLQAENRREELGATGKLGTPCLPRAEVSLVPASHSPSPHGPWGNPLHSVLGGVTWLNPSSQDGGPLVVSAGVQKGAPRRGGGSSVRC